MGSRAASRHFRAQLQRHQAEGAASPNPLHSILQMISSVSPRAIQAKAFTTGQDVFFRQGEYNPGSQSGQELIAHELTHMVQQNGGQRSPQPQAQLQPHQGSVKEVPVNHKATDSKTVEHVIQRYDISYGPLNNDCGTNMHVLVKGNTDPDLKREANRA